MPLSKTLIGELRVILKEEYGADVSEEEAAVIGQNFVRYFDQLIKIIHRSERDAPPSKPPDPHRERAPP